MNWAASTSCWQTVLRALWGKVRELLLLVSKPSKLDPHISQLIYHLSHQDRRARMRSFHLCYCFSKLRTQTAIGLGAIVVPAKDFLNVSRQVLKHLPFVNVQ